MLIAASACIIDENDRCSTGQVLEEGLCRCPPGAAVIENVCVVTAMDAGLDAGEQTGAPEGGLGAACDPTAPCADPSFPRCQQALSGERYCTSIDCKSSSDCMGGYQCVTSSTPSYCRRPYTRQEVPCESASTCTGDARFCSTLIHVCLVEGCTPDSCDPGYTCFKASDYLPGAPNVCVSSGRLPQ